MAKVKTARTPKLVKVGLWFNGQRVIGWRVIWDGRILGVISKPSAGTWEYGGSYFSLRRDAVQRVIDASGLSLVVSA